MSLTGLGKTEVTHLALRQMDRFLPLYEQDDGAIKRRHIPGYP